MFEPTTEFIEHLNRFTDDTGAIIVTVLMPEDDLQELAGLLARWSNGETDLEAVIKAKFAVEMKEGRVY